MATFSSKKITTQPSLGETLADARQQKGISLQQAVRDTKVSSHYLEALEAGEFNKLPGEVYAKNFLRVYAKFLGLNEQALVEQYLTEQIIYNKTKKPKNIIDRKKPVEKVVWAYLVVTPRIIRNVIIGILLIICLSYLGFKLKAITSPPFLQISAPENNLVVSQKVLDVVGQTEKEIILKINGQLVLTDKEGDFSETLVLNDGINIIEIVAQKKHSKQAVVYRKVIVKQEENN